MVAIPRFFAADAKVSINRLQTLSHDQDTSVEGTRRIRFDTLEVDRQGKPVPRIE